MLFLSDFGFSLHHQMILFGLTSKLEFYQKGKRVCAVKLKSLNDAVLATIFTKRRELWPNTNFIHGMKSYIFKMNEQVWCIRLIAFEYWSFVEKKNILLSQFPVPHCSKKQMLSKAWSVNKSFEQNEVLNSHSTF